VPQHSAQPVVIAGLSDYSVRSQYQIQPWTVGFITTPAVIHSLLQLSLPPSKGWKNKYQLSERVITINGNDGCGRQQRGLRESSNFTPSNKSGELSQ